MTTRDNDHDHRSDGDPDDGVAAPSADELREAEALARALEPGARDGAGAPADALEMAALVRGAGAGVPLPTERAAAVAARLGPPLEAQRAAAARARGRRAAVWAAGGAVPVIALACVLALQVSRRAPPLARAVSLPAPPAELLEAQAGAARGGAPALAALDRRMRDYRRQYLDQLARRAGGGGGR